MHALIELGAAPGLVASVLGARLRLEKSSVSRMLRKLAQAGLVAGVVDGADARRRPLFLTAAGEALLAEIHAFGRAQVAAALARLPEGEAARLHRGLAAYAEALAAAPEPVPEPVPVEIVPGYRPGLFGRLLELQARHYAATAGFGAAFEARVAAGMAEFVPRLGQGGGGQDGGLGRNQVWAALRQGEVVGGIAIDGEDLGENLAHLRWFILAPGLRGAGVGRRLLASALAFCDAAGFRETRLWTFRGLDAARHLYEAQGFTLLSEYPATTWGPPIPEQFFSRFSFGLPPSGGEAGRGTSAA
ncbi:helix-turn-helix domain-containing GNAT family N-acetyltransferase [Roseomonas sp. GC11]|nr:helix-turn-helix domain-containing GNAT family N-acetyltransferase [Roseomonas sp. GC11]